MNEFYFYLDIKYDPYTLSKELNLSELEWSTYGPRTKKTLYVHSFDLSSSCIQPILDQFQPGIIDNIMVIMTRRFGEVLPHLDTRPTSILLPLSGNFSESCVEFYSECIEKHTTMLEGADSIVAPSVQHFVVGDPILTVSYTKPICINVGKVIHSVKNPTKDNRYAISISVNKNLSFEELKQEYISGRLLKN